VGGYASIRLTPGTRLRADGGFSYLDGGFSYIKQSISQQYGFAALHETHTLTIEELYTGYVSAELGLRRGKNTFCFGLLGQYMYGARGDIESTRRASNEQTPVTTRSENIWLSTLDMHKVSLHGVLGVRSRISRRWEAAALLRIPVTETVRIPGDASDYQFQVRSHGISPHFTMSYQINQQ
jgi:hypothetical protein